MEDTAGIDYKQKYKTLKKKLYCLIYEQEAFIEELKKSQRKLLRLHREKSFLLDRLLPFEKIDDTSDDSDATDVNDDVPTTSVASNKNRKRLPAVHSIGKQRALMGKSAAVTMPTAVFKSASSMASGSRSKVIASLKRSRAPRATKPVVRRPRSAAVTAVEQPVAVATVTALEADTARRTRELLSIGHTPHSLPDDIFNDSLTGDGMPVQLKDDGEAI